VIITIRLAEVVSGRRPWSTWARWSETVSSGTQPQAARECARPRARAGDPVLQPLPARPSAGGGEARRREEMEEVYGCGRLRGAARSRCCRRR